MQPASYLQRKIAHHLALLRQLQTSRALQGGCSTVEGMQLPHATSAVWQGQSGLLQVPGICVLGLIVLCCPCLWPILVLAEHLHMLRDRTVRVVHKQLPYLLVIRLKTHGLRHLKVENCPRSTTLMSSGTGNPVLMVQEGGGCQRRVVHTAYIVVALLHCYFLPWKRRCMRMTARLQLALNDQDL